MPDYFIGDVHGCFETLCRLLEKIGYRSGADRLFFTGDLVNGGPASAEVLRWVKEEKVSAVLGNHDLHLLAVAAGVRSVRKKDTFSDILEAEDREELLDWLRYRPLAILEKKFLLVHAGVLPEWDFGLVEELAGEVSAVLRGPDYRKFLEKMYGEEPRKWSAELSGFDRLRIVVNAMTRLRMLTVGNEIDFEHKKPWNPEVVNLRPWFMAPDRKSGGRLVVFGHWAALGLYEGENVCGLDSGCVWGGKLTALRLDDGEIFQVESERAKVFG